MDDQPFFFCLPKHHIIMPLGLG